MIAEIFAWFAGDMPGRIVLFQIIVLFVAGISRGLTGFGAAMLFLPLSSMMVGPKMSIGLMWSVDTPASLPISLRAAKRVSWRDPLLLFAAWLATAPLGLWLLTWLDPRTVRWFISIMILTALATLIAGWRYRGKPTIALTLATGCVAGLCGGLAGMSGPPIIILWPADAQAKAANVRDNINAFFLLQSIANGFLLAFWGILTLGVFKLGLLLILPYALGMAIGAALFQRLGEGQFLKVSYATVGAAAVIALPLLDGVFGR